MPLPVPPIAPPPPTDREVLVEIAPIQYGDQPNPHVVSVAQVGDLVHGRDGADNHQENANVVEVRTEHSRQKVELSSYKNFLLVKSP